MRSSIITLAVGAIAGIFTEETLRIFCLANGAWKPLDAQQGLYRDYVKPYMERFAAMGLKPEELGFSGPKDWMEIALRFTLDLKEVQVVSIGTTNPVNAEANLRILKKGPLPKEAVAVIRQAFHAAQERLGTIWPGLT